MSTKAYITKIPVPAPEGVANKPENTNTITMKRRICGVRIILNLVSMLSQTKS